MPTFGRGRIPATPTVRVEPFVGVPITAAQHHHEFDTTLGVTPARHDDAVNAATYAVGEYVTTTNADGEAYVEGDPIAAQEVAEQQPEPVDPQGATVGPFDEEVCMAVPCRPPRVGDSPGWDDEKQRVEFPWLERDCGHWHDGKWVYDDPVVNPCRYAAEDIVERTVAYAPPPNMEAGQ